jgi:hypothetical protein
VAHRHHGAVAIPAFEDGVVHRTHFGVWRRNKYKPW